MASKLKTSLAMGVIAVIALIIIAIVGLPRLTGRRAETDKGTDMSKKDEPQFKYGFRYDPMKWLAGDESLQAARIRTFLFEDPRPGDAKIIQAEIDRILATQDDNGVMLSEKPDDGVFSSGRAISFLLDLGYPPDSPEIQKAAGVILASADRGEDVTIYALHALARLGKLDHPRTQETISGWIPGALEGLVSAFGPDLPRTPDNLILLLWLGRDQLDAADDLETLLSWVDDHLTPAATGVGLCPMWNLFGDITAVIENPRSASIAATLVPTILRTQHDDGGWGDRSYVVFATLVKHGLLEKLEGLPALPADWRVARSIPAHSQSPRHIAWNGTGLWVYDQADNVVRSLSIDDGHVVGTIPLPDGMAVTAIGTWGQSLAVTTTSPANAICRIDPSTGKEIERITLTHLTTGGFGALGELDGLLVVGDYWDGHFFVVDPQDPQKKRPVRTAAGIPFHAASHGDRLWVVDALSPAIIKTGLDGEFLEWGEKPFGNQDIAWDGDNLWALDSANGRICLIEKADAGEWEAPEPAAYVTDWLICGPLPSEPLPGEEQLRAGHDTDYLEAVGGEAAAQPAEVEAIARTGWSAQWRQGAFEDESIMFAKVFGEGNVKDHVIYAYATIDSPKDMDAYLAMGVAGSLKVYLNGQLVHDEHLARFAPRETLLIPVRLKQGANGVLVKVDNDIADGGFILRPVQVDPVTLERVPLTADLASSAAPTGRSTAELAAAVKREGGKAWIEGVPNERVGGGWLAIPRGVALLLKHRGEDVDLDHVLAVSGDAFHLSIATQWQFMGYMAIPTNPVENILSAYGYDGGYHHTEPMPKGAEAIRAVTDGLLAEYYAKIDAGRPVLVGGVTDQGCGAWSVVTGYNQDALQLYHVGLAESPRWSNIRGINSPLNDETFESGCWNSQVRGAAWPGMIGHWMDNCGVYLGDKVAEPSARQTALKTLALAVKLHRAADHDGLWMTYFGASAYEHWARMLHELDYPADTVKSVPEPLWDVYSLSQISRLPEAIAVGRSAAANFCQKSAKDLPEAKDHLLAAARAYREEAAIAQQVFAVLLEGTDEQQEAWLSDEANRETGVTAIAQMLEKDEQAVRHIQAALAAVRAPAAVVAAKPSEYGFRVDPMTWVDSAEGVDAALVRRDVFGTATEAGDALIAAEIERLLAETAADTARENHGPLRTALRMGCDPNRPDVKTAAREYVRKALDQHGVLFGGHLALALQAGWSDGDEPLKSLQAYADAPVPPPGQWDPWTHSTALDALHAGRELVDVRESIGRWMKVVDEGMDQVACWHKMDVWSLLDSLSYMNDPLARGVIERYIPVLLRTQGPDGGWGGKGPQVFRALAKHGLLDELRAKPPLPAEWRVVRTIPAPKGKLKTLVSDGERFWVLDTDAKQAVAISPEDGRELKRLDLDLETTRGLGWYDGLLVVTAGGFLEADDPARVVLIDADRDQVVKVLPFTRDIWYPAGAVQIGRLLWTSQDAWITTIDIATGECKGRPYRGAWPLDLAYDGEAIWSTDTLVPGLFRWGTDGRLLDFAEMPFFESFQAFGGDAGLPVAGITHADEGLWVLSPSTGQIALIERVGAAFAGAAPAAPGAEASPVSGPQRMQAVVSTPAFDIPKLADMDASASPAQWGERGFRVDILEPYGPRKRAEEFGARFRLGWDETGLWLHATVTDDEFRSAESIEALWKNQADLILLYVIREKGEFARILIEPGMTDDQPSPRILTSAEGNGLGVRVTREATDGGYVLQGWVPWEAVDITPADGKELRAQAAFLDADGDGDDVIVGGAVWYPGVGTADNTDISYVLRLADQPSPSRTAIVWPGEDRITVTAPAEHIGKTVTIAEGNRTLAEEVLTTDQHTGYATAIIPLPLPPLSHPLAQPVVMLGDRSVGSLSAIVLWGNGQQSFSVAIQAAARALGRDPDLERILCLSSNAFAPSLNAGEDCTSWWMNTGNLSLRCIDTVAKGIGLSARDMDLPKFTGDHESAADQKEYHQLAAAIIREAMADGEIILSPGGWSSERGFAPWCWAGIITEAPEDGTILGACLTGRTDNVLEHVYGLWALSPAEPTLSAHEADLIMLQQAVDRIRGAGRFAADGNVRFGLDAMDTYIEHMRTVPGFCAGCFERAPDRAWGDARDSAAAVHDNAKVAASYLRRRIGTFSVDARTHIDAAAGHYDRIVELLGPFVSDDSPEHYQKWINGDLDAQKRHADDVLVPVRAELAAAGDAMERVLAAESVAVTPAPTAGPAASAVKREGSKVWIEGVPNMPVGKGREWDGLLKGLRLLTAHRGDDVTLEELMALSGDAFHICFGTKWQERTSHKMPTDPLVNAAGAMGYACRWTTQSRYHRQFGAMTSQQRGASAREYLQEVHSQIDAGMPVLFGGVYGMCGDWRAAVGYDPAEDLICYVGDVKKPYDWTDVYDKKVLSDEFGYWDAQLRGTVRPGFTGGWIGNTAFLLGEKTRDVPEAEQVMTALSRAVQLHRASSHPRGDDTFYFGARAYEQWAKALHELVYPADFDRLRGDNPESYDFSTMGYLADQIVRGRSAAAAYCERAAGLWPVAEDHLLAAAKAYREEATIAQETFGVFLTGTEAQREAWLSDEAMREAGVTAVAEMLEKEQLAIQHIQVALAAASAPVARVTARPSEYGFRVDPMTWVDNAEGLDAALVRRDVFATPKEGDDAAIQAEIDRLLAEVGADTAYVMSLFRALKLGCDRNRPEVRRAVAAYLDGRFADHADGDIAMVLLLAGDKSDVTRRGLQNWIDMSVKAPRFGVDPAQPTRALETLLAGQDLADISNAVRPWVDGIDEGLDEVACWSKMDPWGILDVIGRVNDPRARGIVERHIPILLRTQDADGGWGRRSLAVFRALVKYGLLDELRAKPPLPAEWRVARRIRSPEGSHHSLTWDGSRFWTLDPEAKQAIALSPTDGRELKRLDLDLKSPRGVGWYDGLLVVFSGGFMEDNEPARMVLIDVERDRVIKEMPFTAGIWYPMGGVQIGRKLWTAQGCWVTSIDIATGECKGQPYRGAWARDLAYDGQALWGIDNMMPALYRYDVQGRLLDFAEVPFFESISKITADLPDRPVSGIACTDEGLWVLSNSTGQIALIERVGPVFAGAAPIAGATAAPGAPVAGSGQPMQTVQATPVFDIPKVEFDGLTVEGRPFDWGERGFRVDVMTPFGPRRPVSEFGARFRLGWDDTGLMLLATVTDDQFHSAESVEKLWANEADLILLYLIREAGEVVRIVIEPGMTADQPSPRTITDGGGNSLGVRVTRETTDGGYVLQAWVPWTEVGIEPAAGAELRAQVIVLDVDKRGENIQMGGALWYPAVGTQQDTNISHRLRLADQPSTPQVALVEALDDHITITAAAEQGGKPVTVVEGGRTLAEAILTGDDATGYAVGNIPLPLPPLSSPIAQPTVMLDGRPIAALNPLQLRLDNYAARGHNNDTMSMALVAAAKALGKDADFEAVVCLSANAFAPMLDTGETCTA